MLHVSFILNIKCCSLMKAVKNGTDFDKMLIFDFLGKRVNSIDTKQ